MVVPDATLADGGYGTPFDAIGVLVTACTVCGRGKPSIGQVTRLEASASWELVGFCSARCQRAYDVSVKLS